MRNIARAMTQLEIDEAVAYYASQPTDVVKAVDCPRSASRPLRLRLRSMVAPWKRHGILHARSSAISKVVLVVHWP